MNLSCCSNESDGEARNLINRKYASCLIKSASVPMPVLGTKMELNQAFGRVFARIRTQAGLTQEDFHPAATDRYVRMLEKGKASPTIAMFCELSNVLKVSPALLLALTMAEAEGLSEREGLQALQVALDDANGVPKP